MTSPKLSVLITIYDGACSDIGRNFPRKPTHKISLQCRFNNETLSTDPVSQSANPIWDTEMAWDIDSRTFHFLRSQRTQIKVQCFSVSPLARREALGYIMLDLRSAEDGQARERWIPLMNAKRSGTNTFSTRPEIKLAFGCAASVGVPRQKTPVEKEALFRLAITLRGQARDVCFWFELMGHEIRTDKCTGELNESYTFDFAAPPSQATKCVPTEFTLHMAGDVDLGAATVNLSQAIVAPVTAQIEGGPIIEVIAFLGPSPPKDHSPWHQYRFAIDIRGVRDLRGCSTAIFYFKYAYPPFGTNAPFITHPPVRLFRNSEVPMDGAFCAYEFVMSSNQLHTVLDTVPLEIYCYQKDEFQKDSYFGRMSVDLGQVFNGQSRSVPIPSTTGNATPRNSQLHIIDSWLTAGDGERSVAVRVVMSVEDFGEIADDTMVEHDELAHREQMFEKRVQEFQGLETQLAKLLTDLEHREKQLSRSEVEFCDRKKLLQEEYAERRREIEQMRCEVESKAKHAAKSERELRAHTEAERRIAELTEQNALLEKKANVYRRQKAHLKEQWLQTLAEYSTYKRHAEGDAGRSDVCRLREERALLLKSGVYTESDSLIRELTTRIGQLTK